MSGRKRKWDCEYVEPDPTRRRRSESYAQAGSPHRRRFHHGDRFPGRQSEKYELFFGWQSPFSQHHPVNFTVDGKDFNCAEQYYMYRKATLFEDKDIEEKIMNSRDPKEQKRLGKQIQNFDFDTWMQHSQGVVEKGNMAKFSQNPHLKEKLFATAPRLMVEASPHDDTWGIALHRNDPRAWDERTWRGQNLLGQIITRVRDNLMKQDGYLDVKEYDSYGSTHRSPVTHKQKTDSLTCYSRRVSDSSLSSQRSNVSEKQKMQLRETGRRRDSERDSDYDRSRSPARKKQRNDGWEIYNRRDGDGSLRTQRRFVSEKMDWRETGSRRDSERDNDCGRSRSPSRRKQRTDGGEIHRRDIDDSLCTQRSPVSKEQMMDSKIGSSRRDSDRDSDCGPPRKKQRTDGQDNCSRGDSERSAEMEKERKCGRSRKKESSLQKSLEKSNSEETDSDGSSSSDDSEEIDSDGSSSSDDSDRGCSVMCQTSKAKRHLRKEKKKSGKISQKKEEYSSSSEASPDRKDKRKKHSVSSSKSKSEDLKGIDRENTTAELCIREDGKRVDREDNRVVSGREERQSETDWHSKERTSVDTDKDNESMQWKVKSEGTGSGDPDGQKQKSYDSEDGKRKSSLQHSKHADTRTGSEDQRGGNQRREDWDMEILQDDTVTEKTLHGGEHDVDVGALETGRKLKKEKGEHHESKEDDHLVIDTKRESGRAEKEGGEAEKGESEDVSPTVVQAHISDIPHAEHVSLEKMETENTSDVKGSDMSDNESEKVIRDEADDDESCQEDMIKVITDHKMEAVGCGGEEGETRMKDDEGGDTESQMIHMKRFKKSAKRHYRDNNKVSDTDSGEMDAGSRRSRKHMDSGKKQRRKSGDRVDRGNRDVSDRTCEGRSRNRHIESVCRSSKDHYERTTNDTSETRHASRRNSIHSERSRKHHRDRSKTSGKGSSARTSHWKESEDYKDNMVRKDSESSKDKDKDSKDSHDSKVIGGDNHDIREGESPKVHKQRKQHNDNCTSKVQKKKKKAQEIKEKRNKKKAQRKEMRNQRKAMKRERSRSVSQRQGHDDKGEG